MTKDTEEKPFNKIHEKWHETDWHHCCMRAYDNGMVSIWILKKEKPTDKVGHDLKQSMYVYDPSQIKGNSTQLDKIAELEAMVEQLRKENLRSAVSNECNFWGHQF